MGKTKVHLKGIRGVVAQMSKEFEKIKGGTMKGAIEASIFIRRDMEFTSPKIPIEFGNLRSSWFLVTSSTTEKDQAKASFSKKGGNKDGHLQGQHQAVVGAAKSIVTAVKTPMTMIGFSANYAAAVHENMDEKVWKRPGSGPKFLENSMKRNMGEVLKIMAKNAKI